MLYHIYQLTHRGGSVAKLLHKNSKGQQEGETTEGKSDGKGTLDAFHVGLKDSGKYVGREDITQLRSTSCKS